MPPGPAARFGANSFSEKGFYLSELRDRPSLEPVLRELEENPTRVVLISDTPEALESLLKTRVLEVGDPSTLPGRVWRSLGSAARVGVVTDAAHGFGASCRQIVSKLGIRKVVWVDEGGGLLRESGERDSFIDAEELRERIRAGGDSRRLTVLVEIEAMLHAGVAAVNLCTLTGVSNELFTYDGAGTLFTCEGYVAVRRLGLDDFDAAADLIERGMSEGYLAPRSAAEIERVLASGFGAFIGGNHLAGIGTLLLYGADRAAEIASLYTLTRFLGEGVGGHLVRFAIERARECDCAYVFACTTSERVAAFFERNGFRAVAAEQIPAEKWRHYDRERRALARCLRREF